MQAASTVPVVPYQQIPIVILIHVPLPYPIIANPVAIVRVVHPTEDKVLLDRQKTRACIRLSPASSRYGRGRQEEEAGIVIGSVAYHSSQSWIAVSYFKYF
ncbi:hypothetical protein BC937DRAFT_87589 [Endogone sp. FLAS-F59071]|nr:hypothetical protein BC937DRAFT_87589 [Endogone sp. FLAS-F59071]|eukprot:RUS19371.1 hypothetical protein BC937DRAFT_87589 [Endogone sp. FLAS-F59071]